jgi:hypothetical protein
MKNLKKGTEKHSGLDTKITWYDSEKIAYEGKTNIYLSDEAGLWDLGYKKHKNHWGKIAPFIIK